VIATLQIKDVLGLQLAGNPARFFDRVAAMVAARRTTSATELAVAAITLGLLVLVPRLTKRIPAPLIAVPLGALAALAINRFLPGPRGAPPAAPSRGAPSRPPLPLVPWHAPGPNGAPFPMSFETVRELLPGAFAVAMLGGMESLLSGVIADGMAGTR